ncbi:MAG: hypothetical protein ACK5LR_05920 [Mangrovibacterium sp.]
MKIQKKSSIANDDEFFPRRKTSSLPATNFFHLEKVCRQSRPLISAWKKPVVNRNRLFPCGKKTSSMAMGLSFAKRISELIDNRGFRLKDSPQYNGLVGG